MRDSERSLGFGFVCFTSPDEASEAIREMNGRVVGSNFLNVQLAPKPEDFKVHSDDQYMQNFSSNKNVAEPLVCCFYHFPRTFVHSFIFIKADLCDTSLQLVMSWRRPCPHLGNFQEFKA